MKRRNYCLATTLLLLSIFLETATPIEIVAADSSVQDVVADHSESTSGSVASVEDEQETNNNMGSGGEKLTNTDAVEGNNNIDDDEEHNHYNIPSSIAKATLVGARLRQRQQQQQDDITDSSHSNNNNNNRHNIDVNLLDWEELPTTMKEAALTLGCNSQMWDSGEESSQCELFWSELTQEEQRAAMVLGYQSSSWDREENDQEDDEELSTYEVDGDDDADDASQNPKAAHVTGCHHWGAMGCNKGTASWNAGSTTTASKINATPGVITDDDHDATIYQSSLAGSATAKIEAHVMKGAGQSSLSAKKDLFKAKKVGLDSSASNNPPQGFTLAARIVTSPQDGLSYFLDVPEIDMTTMMTIPYTYVSCGQNIESTSEAFSLEDLVVRHLPAGADISHWVNLGGGVTIDTDDDDEGSSPRYINGNHDGRPKLLVALTPIEIIVSGNDEESRSFNPGEIILMEDTLGKGHKMRANSRGKDLSVIMISLPHTVHYPAVNWSSVKKEHTNNASPSDDSASSWHSAAHQSLFGFAAPKHRHPRSKARHTTKPCPLEYDSAYLSLFTPTSHTKIRRKRRRRDRAHDLKRRNSFATTADSSEDSNYPPPPGFSTYNEHDQMSIFKYLPSLRQSMLIGIGLSLTSSFVYCAQMLYPPFLALWGGATIVVLGGLANVIAARWLYQQNWMVVWEEERRWKREVKRHKKRRDEEEEATKGKDYKGSL